MKTNPFPKGDADRHEIWDMLVARDIAAFADADWETHAKDFLAESFFGIDAKRSDNPDSWSPGFTDLPSYRDNWTSFSNDCHGKADRDSVENQLLAATTLRDIDIKDDFAIAHKKFDGTLTLDDGSISVLDWQTLYLCRRSEGRWWIAGFVGFLPNPMGGRSASAPVKSAPHSRQHVTAGPYSPALEVKPGTIAVISGQAAIDMDGSISSTDFRKQTRHTLENCFNQLAAAACKPADVFKVNVYVTDLENWPAFNEVYQEMMPEPRPVRTAVQTGLLPGLLVEVEMWAVRS